MAGDPNEHSGVIKQTDILGLPNPKTMFEPQAFEATGLKTEFQLQRGGLPQPGDGFVYFGKWVYCVQPVGSNFYVTYDINQDRFSAATLIGVDSRCIGTPRKINQLDAGQLQRQYEESQQVLVTSETPAFPDNTQYALSGSELGKLNLKLITADGSSYDERTPVESRKIRLGTLDDVHISNTGNISEHIIVLPNSNSPTIVVGDWHQSIIAELPILKGLGLLQAQLPVQIDWLDEHTDEYPDFHPFGGTIRLTESERLEKEKLLSYPKTVKEALQKTRKIHCGNAALALSGEVTHVTNPSIFNDLPPTKWVDIFNTVNPFIRKSKQPHILSIDCDFFDYWCRSYRNPTLEDKNFNDLTTFLTQEKGLDLKQYNAVMVYTSPKYCKPEVAQKVIDFVRELTTK